MRKLTNTVQHRFVQYLMIPFPVGGWSTLFISIRSYKVLIPLRIKLKVRFQLIYAYLLPLLQLKKLKICKLNGDLITFIALDLTSLSVGCLVAVTH